MSHYVYKRQAIEELVPGKILGKMIITNDGKNFLNEGAVLNLRVIQTLKMWGFRYLDIREEIREEAVEGEASSPAGGVVEQLKTVEPTLPAVEAEPISEAVTVTEPKQGQQVQESACQTDVSAEFAAYYQEAVRSLKTSLGRARFIKDGFAVDDLRQMVNECVLPMIDDTAVMDNLQMIPHSEDYLYHHSVEVGIIAGCLGMWLGQPFREIEESVLGALLHDVGKALIPLKVLNKPGALTDEEMELVRFHPVRGYKFLKQTPGISPSIMLCALQHHERLDGSGYPLAVSGDKIHPYAKIIAVADVYDAMTSDRSYGRRVTPYEAVEVLRYEMVGKLDSQVCSVLVDKLSQRFVGDFVELSNGQQGEIVFLNLFDYTRPVVRTPEGDFFDLDKDRNLSICKMLHA